MFNLFSPFKIYIAFSIIGLSIVYFLVSVLRSLINKQIKNEIDIFSEKAKIPKGLRNSIGIKINLN